MTTRYRYPIGKPGTPWGKEEKQTWLNQQRVQRSYHDDVIRKIENLRSVYPLDQYGELIYDEFRYPLFAVKSPAWSQEKPTILITGGVHGYETSGVHGALRFVETQFPSYINTFNFIVAPCISPWGYETINRWNPEAIDPNRSFKEKGRALEAKAIMNYIAETGSQCFAHFDLHETTDTDNSEFRPALAARDGKADLPMWEIPDGFYLVGNRDKPADAFQAAIIQSVRKVTHIAAADDDGKIIGELISQEGVINYDVASLGLCAGFTGAEFTTTTEVYPDSKGVTDEQCILAQVAAVVGGLEYLKQQRNY